MNRLQRIVNDGDGVGLNARRPGVTWWRLARMARYPYREARSGRGAECACSAVRLRHGDNCLHPLCQAGSWMLLPPKLDLHGGVAAILHFRASR